MPKRLTPPPLTYVECPYPQQAHTIGFGRDTKCNGVYWGHVNRDTFFYWGRRIGGRVLVLEKITRVWNIFIECILVSFAFLCFAFVGYGVFTTNTLAIADILLLRDGFVYTLWFCIGVLVFAYVVARWWRSRRVRTPITVKQFGSQEDILPPRTFTWQQALATGTKHRVDMSRSFSHEAMSVLELGYTIALFSKAAEVTPRHLFVALAQFAEIESIFARLNVWRDLIEAACGYKEGFVASVKKHRGSTERTIPFSHDVKQVVCQAYEEAYAHRQEEVGLAEVLIATVRQDESLQNILYDLGVEPTKLNNVISWVRVRNTLRALQRRRHKAATHMPRGQTNKAMTALATPFLNQFSIDVTRELARGALPPSIGREKELEEVFRIIEGGGKSVLLVGEPGVGKSAIINAIAELMLEDAVPQVMKDSRLVQLSVPALLSGATPAEAGQRLLQIFNEVGRSGNIVLVIENIEDMVGVTSGGAQSLDVSEVLAQELQRGYFFTIATTQPEYYRRYISHSALASAMQEVIVPEMSIDETIRVLEAKVGGIEYKNNVWFSYAALEAAATFAGRYMYDQYLPSPAIEVCREAAHMARQTKGKNALVTDQDVAAIIAGKTHIPVTAVTEDEGQRLLRLEKEMHKRVIGQDEAVDVVASALRRARAQLRSDNRPIATFLFLGPTGVGKTELAKTIAEVYFGREDNMIRLDMSEFQDSTAVVRLLGRPGEQATGVLTEAVRQKPFSLVLLDELEKAAPDVLNLFLQVFDDGRLTDSVGRTVDFTNAIIIATSNAGTSYIQQEVKKNTPLENIRTALMENELSRHYRPEFLNRFDGIVVFTPLDRAQIMSIARLMLQRIVKNMDERGVTLEFNEEAIAQFAQEGYDPQFGARPMRRVIQQHVEDTLASMVLEKKLKRGMHIVYGKNDTVDVLEG